MKFWCDSIYDYIAGVTLSGDFQIKANLTEFGSMLFLKSVSGTRYVCVYPCVISTHCSIYGRVVAPGESKTIGPQEFTNWGSHHNCYPTAYFTVAAAIGMCREEADVFVERLDKVFVKFKKKQGERSD